MKRVFVGSFLVLVATYGTAAQAQEVSPNYFEQQMAAPAQAFEIGVSGLYNQGWGNLSDNQGQIAATTGRRVQDIAGPGVAVEVDLGYRASPMFAIGVFGQGSEYDADQRLLTGTNVRSLSTGIQGTFFMRPYKVVSPWISLASAYRGYWIDPEVGGVVSTQGWEIARLQIGADLRASRDVAFGPYVGGAFDMFFSQKFPNTDARNLDGPPVAVFIQAGLLGRFDLGGPRLAPAASFAKASR